MRLGKHRTYYSRDHWQVVWVQDIWKDYGGGEDCSAFTKFTKTHLQFWSRSMQKTSVRFNELSQFTQAVGHSVEEGEGRRAGEQKL